MQKNAIKRHGIKVMATNFEQARFEIFVLQYPSGSLMLLNNFLNYAEHKLNKQCLTSK